VHATPRRFRTSRSVAIPVLATGVLALVGCGSSGGGSSDESSAKGGGGGDYTIAYLAQGTTNSFAAQLDAIVKKVAKESGKVKELTYFDAAGDADKQLGQIETALAQKPDAIVLTPLGRAADTGPVERAAADGIPVVLCASGVDSEKYTSLVTPQTYQAAKPLAEWLVNDQLKGNGTIASVDGIAGNDTSEQFGKALRDVVADAPGVKIVKQGYGSFSVSKSKQLAQTFISSGTHIDGWWGSGGESVAGIMNALVDAKVKPMPPVAGAAATNGTLRLAKENDIPIGMVQFPATLGKNCMDTALDALDGKKVPKLVNVSALPGNEDFFTQDIDKYFNPKYTDDYQTGSDKVLSEADLRSLNLVK
jgi:ribose transport system substrate-binding protein